MMTADTLARPQFSRIDHVKAQPSRVLTVEELWQEITSPSDDLRARTARIRQERDKDRKKAMKASLPGVLISGVFAGREGGDLTQHSGYFVYDYDHVTDTAEILWKLLDCALPSLVGAFISPSGDGVKVVLKGPQCAHAEEHRKMWEIGQFVLAGALGVGVVEVDAAADVNRVCYLCDCSAQDAQIYRDGAVPFGVERPAATQEAENDDGISVDDMPSPKVQKVPLEQVRDMLGAVGAGVGYGVWKNCVLASIAHLGRNDEVVAMLKEWSLSDGREWTAGEQKTFDTLVANAEVTEGPGRVGIGTLTRLASEKGWRHWDTMLRRETLANGRVRVAATEYNVKVLLTYHPMLKGRMWRDEVTGIQQMEPRAGAWCEKGGPLENSLAWDVVVAIQEHLHLKLCSVDGMMTALGAAADARVRNLRREWLLSLKWDGVKRMGKLFIDGFGAEDTKLNRVVAETWLIGAASRTLRPGVDFQVVPVLIGAQGIGKSTGLGALMPDWRWFLDTKIDMAGGKAAYEIVRQATVVELQELAGVRKAEVESVKAFVSAREVSYRASYARQTSSVLASWVFIGTTNEEEFLTDTTGNRRFVPVRVKRGVDTVAWCTKNRDQLWAEATHYGKATGNRVILPQDVWGAAAEAGESAYVMELLEERVVEYTARSEHGAEVAMKDAASAVGCEDIEDKWQQMKLSKFLRKHGWEKVLKRVDGIPTRVWRLEKEEL